jgi:hypothetical protein
MTSWHFYFREPTAHIDRVAGASEIQWATVHIATNGSWIQQQVVVNWSTGQLRNMGFCTIPSIPTIVSTLLPVSLLDTVNTSHQNGSALHFLAFWLWLLWPVH